MDKVSVLHPPKPRCAEDMRALMDSGSLNLHGVVAILRRLEEDCGHAVDNDLANTLHLLARDVDCEASAMGEVEAFLSSLS